MAKVKVVECGFGYELRIKYLLVWQTVYAAGLNLPARYSTLRSANEAKKQVESQLN